MRNQGPSLAFFVNLGVFISQAFCYYLLVFLLFLSAYLLIFIGGFNNSYISDENVAGVATLEESNLPSLTPTLIPSPTPTPFGSPKPTAKAATPTPIPKTKQHHDTDIHVYPYKTTNDLLQQINSFRHEKGLGQLSANSEACFFASIRANEIITNFNHDGFRNRIDSKSLPYPSYSKVAENIAMNGDANEVIPGWINSQGHAENLLKDVPFGCVVGNGDYYVFEAWKP